MCKKILGIQSLFIVVDPVMNTLDFIVGQYIMEINPLAKILPADTTLCGDKCLFKSAPLDEVLGVLCQIILLIYQFSSHLPVAFIHR